MFAFLFDEGHPEMPGVFGADCASPLVRALQDQTPPPETHLLVGSLLFSNLTYQIGEVSHVVRKADDPPWRGGSTSQRMVGQMDHYLTLVCDLAETLHTERPGLVEADLLKVLPRHVWVITMPTISRDEAIAAHTSALAFGPYVGFVELDDENPLHRTLFVEYLLTGRYLKGRTMYFSSFEDDDFEDFVPEDFGSEFTLVLPPSACAEALPPVPLPRSTSARGRVSAERAKRPKGYRQRVAETLLRDRPGVDRDFEFVAKDLQQPKDFTVNPRKLTDYALDLSHPKGGAKAAFFRDVLAIERPDWRFLADQLVQGARRADLYRLAITEREFVHGAIVKLTGRNGRQAVVETGWRLQTSGPAELVTVYPAKPGTGTDVEAVVGRVPSLDLVGDALWSEAFHLADAAGRLEAEQVRPTPMVLRQYGTIWEGACGFAWVRLPDGRTKFARWMARQGYTHPTRPGVGYFSPMNTQSIDISLGYARGFADVLLANGIECSVESRLD